MANLTFPSGESLSDSIDLKNLTSKNGDLVRLFGLDIPAEWTTANLTVLQKHADGLYKPVKDESGDELVITSPAGAPIRFGNPAKFSALDDIKLLSGVTGTAVEQVAERTVGLILRGI